LPLSEPLRATWACDGTTVVAPAESTLQLGHLEGWGNGLHGGPGMFAPWTRGNTHQRRFMLVVEGSGSVTVTVGSSRTGSVSCVVRV
ncbi:MAG: peptidase M14, partial [Betaproteobacteria bacterium]